MRTSLAFVMSLWCAACSSPTEEVAVDAAVAGDGPTTTIDGATGKVCSGVHVAVDAPATGCATSSCAACPVPMGATGATCSASGACDFACAPGELKTATGCGAPAMQIVAGASFTCALSKQHLVRCWGTMLTTTSNVPVTVAGLVDITAIAAGREHACAVTAAGAVKCWGRNTDGQLGNGMLVDSATPVDVNGLTSGVVAIAAGQRHTCAMLATGDVQCWGDNLLDQLGRDTPGSSTTPLAIAGANPNAIAIAAGPVHTCIVSADHHVTCWGNGESGQLGNNAKPRQSLAVEAVGLTDAISIAAGGYGTHSFTCAIRTQGKVSCWGTNFWGNLGIGTNTADAIVPAELATLSGVTELALGTDAACAVRASTLSCWGHGDYGKIGHKGWAAPNGYHWLPTPTAMPELAMPAVHAAVGDYHSCFVTDTELHCVGAAGIGQLGDGVSTVATDTAVVVAW
jgi:hypothetical protein